MKKAYLIILGSFAFLMLGGLLVSLLATVIHDEMFMNLVVPGLLLGFCVLFVWGTGRWAEAKGHPMLLGILLGWAGPLGLLVLVFLRDKGRA